MCTLNCCKLLAISYFLSIIASLSSYLKHSKPILDFLYPTWHPGNGRLFAFASMWFSCWRLGLFIARLDCTSRFLEQKKRNPEKDTRIASTPSHQAWGVVLHGAEKQLELETTAKRQHAPLLSLWIPLVMVKNGVELEFLSSFLFVTLSFHMAGYTHVCIIYIEIGR